MASEPAVTHSSQTQEIDKEEEEEEEYVLMEFDCVLNVPPNVPYTLSRLDTMNPVLTIGDGTTLIGEYVERVGSCIVFSEEEEAVVHEETGPSEKNLFAGKRIVDPNQAPKRQIKGVCQVQKVLRFKPQVEAT